MRTLILGCGYLGTALGAALAKRGHPVWGLRRSSEHDDTLYALGIQPVKADLTQPGWASSFSHPIDWAVYCAAPRPSEPEAHRRIYDLGVRQAISELLRLGVRTVVYTGSTGVYDARQECWVTEETPIQASDEKARLLASAEEQWLEFGRTSGASVVILRISGMYGAGRGYWLRRFFEGPDLLDQERHRWINQVHRDDVVGALMVALERSPKGRIYNVTDDEPTTPASLFAWLEERLGRPPANRTGVLPRANRGTGLKRVSNTRLKTELGWTLQYPTYREGYRAELRRMGLWPLTPESSAG
ncbi:MAG: NAD-dependent epimerase/dehydratase family protein [Verrucomicrobiota bacterium]|nr:NAD-dependent epimerase/dehydratase family protein [Limisphaera sp.]MDW8381309.1 NAD-dependent epimerase/dehydratase family protein [Verrucomicrobiota bacterium]